MQTTATLDVVKFFRVIIQAAEADVQSAYDRGFDEEEAHTALQSISGKLEALSAFLNALTLPPVAPIGAISLSKD